MAASKREMLLIEFLTFHSKISYLSWFFTPFKTNDKLQVVLTPKQFGTYFLIKIVGKSGKIVSFFSLIDYVRCACAKILIE